MSTNKSSRSVSIRPATPADIQTILGFIKDLAVYEKEPDAAKATPELIQTNVFDKKYANVILAEDESGKALGMALYFFTFSTWIGKPSLYLEDLYVSETERNLGIGKRLFRELGKIAEANDCQRIDWSVLTWNTPSIAFYEKVLGATRMEEWRQMRLDADGIQRLQKLGLQA